MMDIEDKIKVIIESMTEDSKSVDKFQKINNSFSIGYSH